MPAHPLHRPVLAWYRDHARALPWRDPGAGPWAVLVSEVMLQQTPVARVLPVYLQWLARWPTPRALAVDSPGEAVRLWGRLGYPRRALRLHAAAVCCVQRHDAEVPSDLGELRALPGVGPYTAAAVASFAFGQRHAVLDTNVRRVLSRVLVGHQFPSGGAAGSSELAAAAALMPDQPRRAARWAVAVMELGAVVCTARSPACAACPVSDQCRWRTGGYPPWDGPPRRRQGYRGTDRQARGALLAVLRQAAGPVSRDALDASVADTLAPEQRDRALAALVADGLVQPGEAGCWSLPQ